MGYLFCPIYATFFQKPAKLYVYRKSTKTFLLLSFKNVKIFNRTYRLKVIVKKSNSGLKGSKTTKKFKKQIFERV